MPDPTTNYSWDLPNVGGDSGNWGTLLNDIFNDIDTELAATDTVADAALPKAGGVMTGEVQFLTTVAARVDLGSISGATALNFDAANAWTATISGSTTFSVSNVPAGTLIVGGILKLINGGSASVSWPAAFDWSGGTAPTLSTSGTDLVVFVSLDGGTTWQANALLDFS